MKSTLKQKRNGGASRATRSTRKQIQIVARRIVENFHPERIILFGSYAYGKPTIDSDVDLLVVMEIDTRARQKQLEISRALSPHPFGMDILVCAPRELEYRIARGDFFLQEITTRGKVLYERIHA
jgi:predicted nucleotidyltransferase